MSSLLFRHEFTARCARDRRVRRGKIRNAYIDMLILCVLGELCGEYIIKS
jgi:hypothetical protein